MMRLLALLLCLLAAPTLAQHATVTIPSTVVTGPTSATSGNCASFNGTTGKIIQDAGTTCGGGTQAVTLISTQTASGSANLAWTGLGSSYNTYLLDCNGIQPATNQAIFEIQVGTGGTPTYQTSSYINDGASVKAGVVGGTDNVITAGVSFVDQNTGPVNAANSAGDAFAGKAWVQNISSASLYKRFSVLSAYNTAGGAAVPYMGSGEWNSATTAVTALRVLFSAGNISVGQCSLYGLTP